MFDSLHPAAAVSDNSRPGKASPGSYMELLFNDREAMLSWNGEPLICFQSPVKVSGEEILDWLNKGLLTELISLEHAAENDGIPLTVKEIAPVYAGKAIAPERSSRSLLLNPQWFSVYFITFSEPLFQKEEFVLVKLQAFFEPGKALADYENHKIYLARLLRQPAA